MICRCIRVLVLLRLPDFFGDNALPPSLHHSRRRRYSPTSEQNRATQKHRVGSEQSCTKIPNAESRERSGGEDGDKFVLLANG
ncbi:MAG: hypothetical protein KME30_19035 [Iphinoe sp. HA4291-MV1]|nr:hypothetical protein [Iphinoe sp. HA4291-MV1]